MQKLIFASLLTGGAFLVFNFASAATATHVVISQIQIDGIDGTGGTEDDWVELYNPTASPIDLAGWSIQKHSSTLDVAFQRKDLSLTKGGDPSIIPAFGYFLIVRNHSNTQASLKSNADVLAASNFSLSDDNTVYLVSNNVNIDNGTDPDIVDMVGMGSASNFEGTAAPNPADRASIERKLGSGQGNGEDSDNNSADFFAQSTAHPRNTASATETPPTPSSPQSSDGTSPPPPATSAGKPAGGESGGGPSTGSESSSGFFELEISELMPNPEGADSGSEWVELYNAGPGGLDLSGWYLGDDRSENSPAKSAYKLPANTIISGFQYLGIIIPKGRFILNNTGTDSIKIFDAGGNLRLEKRYAGPAKSGFSYARNKQNQWEWTSQPTFGAENSFEEPVVFATTLRISEVFPDPAGDDSEDEFIEIHNYGKDSVDLTDWIVADARRRYAIAEDDFLDAEIAPNGYFVLYRDLTKIALNNSGEEEVNLFNPAGDLVHRLTFTVKNREEQSYSWSGGEIYEWTQTPTPGRKNKFAPVAGVDDKNPPPKADAPRAQKSKKKSEEKNILEIPLAEIRNQELGTIITTSGVVVVEPGILGERVAYIGGSGIRVFLPQNYDLDLPAGTVIELVGELAVFHNELQLKVSDFGLIKVMGTGEVPDHEILTGEVGEETEGFLVHLAGMITRTTGDTFYMDDGSGEARILILESTGIEQPKMKKGDEVEITGIVTQFNNVYRVLPRYQSDLAVGSLLGASVSDLPRTGVNLWLMFAVLLGFVIISKLKLTINKT